MFAFKYTKIIGKKCQACQKAKENAEIGSFFRLYSFSRELNICSKSWAVIKAAKKLRMRIRKEAHQS